ncbi:MAG: hypothetical protein Q8K43_05590, partial [Sulfurimicrobium sp.]|nr:hypothetical protein [Sulfurimicrobium sp.]
MLASGLIGYYTYHATRGILVRKASQDLLQPTQVLGRRFSILMAKLPTTPVFWRRCPAHTTFSAADMRR